MSSPSAGPRDSSNNSSRTSSTDWQTEERKMVQLFMRDRQVEIIVVVEGVDAATGGMVQARHSYTCDEIEWDKSFVGCVSRDPLDGCTTIDFSRFHDLPVSFICSYIRV
ncbi:hypothetical protein B484DRAFT_434315 [Ochromonadaceae sp. CCMP2298]|nr:hypothetical protein B484DRAFT_434315 [Ochromonadaceae sp. CCMP2298]|mmetsp:Transcript_11808/g.26238  ORF Transcript_11808/g.26238 Transcript_11808/m.26238 type:complete len:109 (-) Transcript_11808:74-400(-)